MLDFIFDALSNFFPVDGPRRDPIVVAYRHADRERKRLDHPEVDRTRLIIAMKRWGVPGIYTEPYHHRIVAALTAWDQQQSTRQFKRTLRRGK